MTHPVDNCFISSSLLVILELIFVPDFIRHEIAKVKITGFKSFRISRNEIVLVIVNTNKFNWFTDTFSQNQILE